MKRKMSLFAMMGLMAIMSLFAQNVQGATIPLTVNAGGVDTSHLFGGVHFQMSNSF